MRSKTGCRRPIFPYEEHKSSVVWHLFTGRDMRELDQSGFETRKHASTHPNFLGIQLMVSEIGFVENSNFPSELCALPGLCGHRNQSGCAPRLRSHRNA